MLVSQILNSKGNSETYTISPGSSVTSAVRLLSQKGIGALVVSDDGTSVVGILSERDVVRALSKRGTTCLNESVDRLMSRSIVTCTRSNSADEALTMMTNGRFRHLPVVEEGLLVGIISIGDVVKVKLGELSMEKQALEDLIMGH